MMILIIILLVAAPLAFWLFSPVSWSYASALEAQKKGDFETAEKLYLAIIKKKPNHTMAFFRLGELAYLKQNFEASLEFADQAMTIAEEQQRPSIINLQTNSLIALKRKKAAIKSIQQLYAFTTLPKEYEKLESEELLPFMVNPANRHFLNSLAYAMAVNEVELDVAQKYMEAVIVYFEEVADQASFTIPYLYERAGLHAQAYKRFNVSVQRIQSPDSRQTAEVEQQINKLLAKSKGKLSNEETTRLRNLELKGKFKSLFLGNNRLKLLAQKLGNGKEDRYSAEMERFRTDYINEENCQMKIDDRKFLQYGYELQHYYDTRAIVRLKLGDQWAAKSMNQREDNIPEFVQSSAEADKEYRLGYQDLLESIEIKSAMDSFLKRYPENSLMISLPSDELASQRERIRIDAIENYHRYLLLSSLGRLDEAEDYRNQVKQMGFEPGPLLF